MTTNRRDFLKGVATVGALAIGETGEAAAVVLLFTLGEAFARVAESHPELRLFDARDDTLRAAIAAGTLAPERLANYRKLGSEVAGAPGQLATRRAQKGGGQKG